MLRVSADHVSARFACNDIPVRIGEYRDGTKNADGTERVLYYAGAAGYGCGHNYRTPREAVIGLLQYSACTNIRVTGEYIPGEWVAL